MTATTERFQLSLDAAEVYESKFVPALFSEWAGWLVEAAAVRPGQAVLDVACGTGIVARTAAERLAGEGSVTGVDVNEAMLAVARRLRPDVEWRQADAAQLPFADDSFDVVLCQASLMYFPDRARALSEMARVRRDDGTVAVQVWARLDDQPGYRPFVELVARHAGEQAIDLFSSYWVMGDLDLVRLLFDQAGLRIDDIDRRTGSVKFDSIDEFVRAEVEGSPLIERISDDVYRGILADAERVLAKFRTPNGRTEIPIQGHIITARRGG